ncbi:hypothetical protein Tco_1517934 [Tanacetum coccineum]
MIITNNKMEGRKPSRLMETVDIMDLIPSVGSVHYITQDLVLSDVRIATKGRRVVKNGVSYWGGGMIRPEKDGEMDMKSLYVFEVTGGKAGLRAQRRWKEEQIQKRDERERERREVRDEMIELSTIAELTHRPMKRREEYEEANCSIGEKTPRTLIVIAEQFSEESLCEDQGNYEEKKE